MDVIQWLFDTEVFTRALNWPVNADGMVFAKRLLDEGLQAKQAAADVMRAYEKFAGAIGPTVMTALLESDEAFPEVNHSGAGTPPASGRIVLYVDPDGACVLAECFTEYGRNPVFLVT